MAHSNENPSSTPPTRWYCHSCDAETSPSLPDYVCSRCQDGFIEVIEDSRGHTLRADEAMPAQSTGESRPGLRRAHIAIHRLQPGQFGGNPFQEFISQFIGSLMGGTGHHGPINIQVAPLLMGNNTGDYVLTPGGLDNVITMLLNQLDGAGPPPARKDQIDALPTVVIVQEQVDSCLQCHICMEEFQLDERVRGLPCKHVYHGECIVPWLELHGTCPICRQSVDTRPDDRHATAAEFPPD